MALSEEKRKALNGELYHAFTPELVRERRRCAHACHRFNTAGEVSRRRIVELWRECVIPKSLEDNTKHHRSTCINGDTRKLPPIQPTVFHKDRDEELLASEPWIEPPIHADYGTNIRIGSNVYINSNCTIIDTCLVTIGSRTLFGPHVSLYSGTHPLDPELRDGTQGPELGKEIYIEDDCWIAGNVTILPGVTIGRGATVGAGSVVTRDVAPFTCVVGNPARFLKNIQTNMDPEQRANIENQGASSSKETSGTEKPAAAMDPFDSPEQRS
ncbi:hypothetical protein MMC06_000050 [Schaereria dolodes]|nr:hypothetical protein [Schaereria dolodes]